MGIVGDQGVLAKTLLSCAALPTGCQNATKWRVGAQIEPILAQEWDGRRKDKRALRARQDQRQIRAEAVFSGSTCNIPHNGEIGEEAQLVGATGHQQLAIGL